MRPKLAPTSSTDVVAEIDLGADGSELDIGECRRMLRMFDGHIKDLEQALDLARKLQVRWHDRLILAESKPIADERTTRAPHGALKGAVLATLEKSIEGMTLAQLHVKIAETLGNVKRRSLSLSLNRLKADGLVAYNDKHWHIV